jgi:hypothetical protein
LRGGELRGEDKMTPGETDPFDCGLRSIWSPWRNTGVTYNGRICKGDGTIEDEPTLDKIDVWRRAKCSVE